MSLLDRIRAWIGAGPVPRDRPKGSDPTRCDGCDRWIGASAMLIRGGYYCLRCEEEIEA